MISTEKSRKEIKEMNEIGYIVIAVKTAGGALPVENAVVTVRDGGGNILYVEFTDESGRTPLLRVAAPPKGNSLSPEASEPPFYTYGIDTDKEGFVSVRNLSVPAYPGITSIQPVTLLPLPEGSKRQEITVNESGSPEL